ncbi:hypothetical protein OH76DRAFT_931995 [Lentinus brumalis]|uniref:Uncharacterized protein n=1 Tax=Lentinus brumalis TaxID=2498619 RepID=A0A371CZX4_9APHY|nr:hypothetical protein OH76DRAFT_931995 [Polyporus brumalis]
MRSVARGRCVCTLWVLGCTVHVIVLCIHVCTRLNYLLAILSAIAHMLSYRFIHRSSVSFNNSYICRNDLWWLSLRVRMSAPNCFFLHYYLRSIATMLYRCFTVKFAQNRRWSLARTKRGQSTCTNDSRSSTGLGHPVGVEIHTSRPP